MKEYVNLKEVIGQHRKVYELEFSIGRIKLKHLSKLDSVEIREREFERHPEYKELCEEMTVMNDLIQAYGMDRLDRGKLDRINVLAQKLKPFVAEFAVPCFVEPKVGNVDDIEAIGDALTPDEWNKLQNMLRVLTAPLPAQAIDIAFVQLCKDYGIKMPEDLNVENMTAQQYQLIEQTAIATEKAMKEQMKELKDGIE